MVIVLVRAHHDIDADRVLRIERGRRGPLGHGREEWVHEEHQAAGAYGDDDSDRPKLVALAQQRASERTGVVFGNDATVMVGATPKDVEAGLAAGVQVIGVTTGKTGERELRDAGAHHLASDLKECRHNLVWLAGRLRNPE